MESSSVYAVIENSFISDLSAILNDQQNDLTLSDDPRAPKEGLKRLVVFDHSNDSISSTIDAGASSVDLYTEKRYELGIAEGPGEIVRNKALPLNYNVDLMNGVSFSKGCYLGQVRQIYCPDHYLRGYNPSEAILRSFYIYILFRRARHFLCLSQV